MKVKYRLKTGFFCSLLLVFFQISTHIAGHAVTLEKKWGTWAFFKVGSGSEVTPDLH